MKRREEFEFALAIHLANGVDMACWKLDTTYQRMAELTRRQVTSLYTPSLESLTT